MYALLCYPARARGSTCPEPYCPVWACLRHVDSPSCPAGHGEYHSFQHCRCCGALGNLSGVTISEKTYIIFFLRYCGNLSLSNRLYNFQTITSMDEVASTQSISFVAK
jgi:hypothetical protein